MELPPLKAVSAITAEAAAAAFAAACFLDIFSDLLPLGLRLRVLNKKKKKNKTLYKHAIRLHVIDVVYLYRVFLHS